MFGCTNSRLSKVNLLTNLLIFISIQCTSSLNKEREMIEKDGNDIVDEFQGRFKNTSAEINNIKMKMNELDDFTNLFIESFVNISEIMNQMKMKMHVLDVASKNQVAKLDDLIILLQSVTHLSQTGSKQKPLPQILDVKCPNNQIPESCYDINECHSNIYSIMIPSYSNHSLAVSCDLKTEDGGWTIIQRRQDGSVDFYRNWTQYVQGFGDVNGEFFIGLEKLHILTTQQNRPQELYILLKDFEGEQRYAKYQLFKVDSKDTDYKLTVGNYSGNAGDSLTSHSGEKFSTFDRDNDSSQSHCAEIYKAAWWHKSCHTSSLNGQYLMGALSKSKSGHGIKWGTFRGKHYSLKFVQMMIRPHKE